MMALLQFCSIQKSDFDMLEGRLQPKIIIKETRWLVPHPACKIPPCSQPL